MKRNQQTLRRMIRKFGLRQYEEQMMQTVRPSIRVITEHVEHENDIPIGQSKIGGLPDLPLGIEWPTVSPSPHETHPSLPFLAQFNLKDIEPFDEEKRLPQQGMLYFFAGITQSKVIFIPEAPLELTRRQFPDDIPLKNSHDDWSERYKPCRVTFVSELNLERIKIDKKVNSKRRMLRNLLCLMPLSSYEDPQSKLEDWLLGESLSPYNHRRPVVNHLLGIKHDVPKDMQFKCQLEADLGKRLPSSEDNANSEAIERANQRKNAWQLLFQLDSDQNADMMWSDMGTLCFYIRVDDLKCGRFDAVCFQMFSG